MFAGSVTALSSCESVCVYVCVHRPAINNTPTPHKAPSEKIKADVENREATSQEQKV